MKITIDLHNNYTPNDRMVENELEFINCEGVGKVEKLCVAIFAAMETTRQLLGEDEINTYVAARLIKIMEKFRINKH